MRTYLKHPGRWICSWWQIGKSQHSPDFPGTLRVTRLLGLLTKNKSQTGLLPQECRQIPALGGMINLWDAASLTVQNQGRVWGQSSSSMAPVPLPFHPEGLP